MLFKQTIKNLDCLRMLSTAELILMRILEGAKILMRKMKSLVQSYLYTPLTPFVALSSKIRKSSKDLDQSIGFNDSL